MKLRKFPKEFLWGSAISAYQAEGGNIGADWYSWEKTHPGIELCTDAASHYRYWEEDLLLLEELNQNAFRLSLEWSRIEPEPRRLNIEALEHYRQVLLRLRQRGITAFVTLNHFTLPQWFLNLGGWERRQNIEAFVNFVDFIVKEFKDLVDFWIPLNEPMMYASLAYYEGRFPPGQKSWFAFHRVVVHMIEAQKRSYEKIHSIDEHAQVGIAKNNQYFEPYASSSFLDRLAVTMAKRRWNHSFLSAVRKHLDFIGVNYYFHNRLRFSLLADVFSPNHPCGFIKNENVLTSDHGVEIYPMGLYHVLMELKQYKLPLYITENGVADQEDRFRQRYIFDHVKYMYIAMKELCDIRGYFYWSLLDNYEWGSFAPRYGLVAVDYKTGSRSIRESARYYSRICKENAIIF